MGILKKSMMVGAVLLPMAMASAVNTYAAETSFFQTETFELKDATFVEDTQYVLTRGNHLASGHIQLSNQGGRVLLIAGKTDCHMTCDKVTCNLYLEQMDDDGNWYTYKYWYGSTTNAYTYAPTRTTSVEGDHWYRARGAHMATKNGTIESVSTLTNGIWVD